MLPTRAALGLFAGGPLLSFAGLVAAAVAPPGPAPPLPLATLGHLLALGFMAGVLLLTLLDGALARRATGPRRLRVTRHRPARLSVGVENAIALEVHNRAAARRTLLLRDRPPAAFRADPEVLAVAVPGRGWAKAGYRLLPGERGNFRFGDVAVRCRGPLGLAWADRAVPLGEDFQVYPNLLEVRRYEALTRATLVRTGGYRAKRLPGAGREFSHYRDYTPDDDYRSVSWKATARRHKPITAVHESEHSQDIVFCLDVGRMMAARVGRLTKLDHAINAVLMLAHVSGAFQDNLGLLVFSHAVHHYLPPAKGRGQQAKLLQALYKVRPELCHVNYRRAFGELIRRHPKRALAVVFTDLLDAAVSREYVEATALLRRFHLPLTLAVADVPLQQLAARTPADVAGLYDVLVARDLLQGRAELLTRLERQGVLVLDTVPERLTVDAVNTYLALKTGNRL